MYIYIYTYVHMYIRVYIYILLYGSFRSYVIGLSFKNPYETPSAPPAMFPQQPAARRCVGRSAPGLADRSGHHGSDQRMMTWNGMKSVVHNDSTLHSTHPIINIIRSSNSTKSNGWWPKGIPIIRYSSIALGDFPFSSLKKNTDFICETILFAVFKSWNVIPLNTGWLKTEFPEWIVITLW